MNHESEFEGDNGFQEMFKMKINNFGYLGKF